MRAGEKLCYDIESTKPDFASDFCIEDTFDPNVFFDYQTMSQREYYMDYVRDNENHGPGKRNPGSGYNRNPNFCMMIVSCAKNEYVLSQ